jgi:chromosome condensin MukBEF ATPase and DNA-binding subunit MukB
MEFNEALLQMKQLVNSYKAVKKLEEVLDFVTICKQREVELTATIDKLQKESFELGSLKADKEGLEAEIRGLNKEKYSAQVALDSLRQDREKLKKSIEEIIAR